MALRELIAKHDRLLMFNATLRAETHTGPVVAQAKYRRLTEEGEIIIGNGEKEVLHHPQNRVRPMGCDPGN